MWVYTNEFIVTNRNLLMSIAAVIEYWRYCAYTAVVFHEYLANTREVPLFARLQIAIIGLYGDCIFSRQIVERMESLFVQ